MHFTSLYRNNTASEPPRSTPSPTPTNKSSTNLWSKFKSQLTLSSEHDGDTENDTVLANAMVKYYTQKGSSIPSWLPGAHNNSQQSQNYGYQAGNQQQNYKGSSLQDMYRRANPTPAADNGNASWRTAPTQTYSQTQTYNQNQQDKTDRFRSKLRSARPTHEPTATYSSNTAANGRPPVNNTQNSSWRSKATW